MKELDLHTLEGMVLDGDEPVFNEPWEAQAFAMTIALHKKNAFTWDEWAAALSAEIHSGQQREYYSHWLSALEKLVASKGMTTSTALKTREREWHQAAARTPHGEAIEL